MVGGLVLVVKDVDGGETGWVFWDRRGVAESEFMSSFAIRWVLKVYHRRQS